LAGLVPAIHAFEEPKQRRSAVIPVRARGRLWTAAFAGATG